MTETAARPIWKIADDIRADWQKTSKKGVYFGAVPYLDAMGSLDEITDDYGQDSGKSVVLYFLSNATTYKGEKAKALKAELKKLAGIK